MNKKELKKFYKQQKKVFKNNLLFSLSFLGLLIFTLAVIVFNWPAGFTPSQAAGGCKDTDGGINLNKNGVVSLGNAKSQDYCFKSAYVQENFCFEDKMYARSFRCASGFCQNGACTKNETLKFTCTDSDGGKKITVAGEVGSNFPTAFSSDDKIYSGKIYKYKDACASKSEVWEYSCQTDGSYIKTKISCADGLGCQDGYCQKIITCTDSDGGKKPSVAGKVTTNIDQGGSDACVVGNANKVTEYYCATNKKTASEIMTCPTGQTCLDGACQKVEIKKAVVTSAVGCAQPLDQLSFLTGFDYRDNLINFAFEANNKKAKLTSLVNQIIKRHSGLPTETKIFGGFGQCVWQKSGSNCSVYSAKTKSKVSGDFSCTNTDAGAAAMVSAIVKSNCCSQGVACNEKLTSYEYLSGFTAKDTLAKFISAKNESKLEKIIDQVIKQFGNIEFDSPNVYAPLVGRCTWMEHWSTTNCYIFGYIPDKKISAATDGICGQINKAGDDSVSLGTYKTDYLKSRMKKVLLSGACCQ